MLAKDLIKKLLVIPPDTEIVVWEGYDAGCCDGDFDIHFVAEDRAVLEP